jgi:hypothetical protein
MDSESDMEVVYNNIICTCICIHNIHNIHSSKTNIFFHFLYYTDKNNTPHYRCTHACTHQPRVSICDLNDLKLSWQLYETRSSQRISHAMVEVRNCRFSPSLQLDVTTGYIMGINTACGHITWHANSWWKRQRQSLKCWTGWLLKTSLNLFLDGSSRHIYIHLLPFGNKHWTSVFFLIQAMCIKLHWNLFAVNILFNYVLRQSKHEEGWWGERGGAKIISIISVIFFYRVLVMVYDIWIQWL